MIFYKDKSVQFKDNLKTRNNVRRFLLNQDTEIPNPLFDTSTNLVNRVGLRQNTDWLLPNSDLSLLY